MFLKQKNFFKTKNIYNFLYENDKKIILFVHVNNLNTLENSLIKYYCTTYKITSLDININLAKKISLNTNFLNLLAGPTKIYAFNCFSSFLCFFNNKYIFQKFIPLAIFWNKNFFSYKFFFNFILSNFNVTIKNKDFNNFTSLYNFQYNKLLIKLDNTIVYLNLMLLQQNSVNILFNIFSYIIKTLSKN